MRTVRDFFGPLSVVATLCLALSAASAWAQPPPSPAPKPTKPAAKPAAAKPAAGTMSVTGPVKGAPTGKTFIVATKNSQTTVDASKAKIRVKGKFVSMDAIKAGTMVKATGQMQGTTLMATDVTAFPSAKKPTPAGVKTPPTAPKPPTGSAH